MSELTSKKIIWTVEKIAVYLNVSRATFYELVKVGLPAVVVNGKWCAHADNLELFFQRRTASGTKQIPPDAE